MDKTVAGYNKVGLMLIKLRENGIIDFDHIVDGSRIMYKISSYEMMSEYLRNGSYL